MAHAPARDVVPFPAAANRVSYLTLSLCSLFRAITCRTACNLRATSATVGNSCSSLSHFLLFSSLPHAMQRRELFLARFRHAPPSASGRILKCKRETLAGPTGDTATLARPRHSIPVLSASTSPFTASHRPTPCHHPSAHMTANAHPAAPPSEGGRPRRLIAGRAITYAQSQRSLAQL